MASQGGFGVVLKINTGSLTTIVKVLEVAFPEQTRELADITAHDSTSGYREFLATGVRELTEFQATILWDDTAATHAALLTNFAAAALVGMSIQDPGGQEIIAFNAWVKTIGRVAQMTEGYKAVISIRPSGAPTIT